MSPRPRRPRADAPTEVLATPGSVTAEYEVEQVPAPAPPEPPPRGWYDEIGWALLALLVLLVVGFAVWWFGFHRTSTPKRTVPAVTGRPVALAVNQLQAVGFKVHISSQSHQERPGIVFSEIPAAGSRVKKGSTIQLIKSNGPSTVTVPNAVGLTEAAGRDRLVAAGFQVKEARVFSQEKAGTIVAQSPAAGSKAAKNAAIRINVSKGSALVIVPNVVGQSVGNAETALAQHGLKGVVQLHVPSAQPTGTVVAQLPAGGQAKRGSEVKLNVSNGAASSGASGATGATGASGPTGPTGTG
jgi:serine/threonine-protein kinase